MGFNSKQSARLEALRERQREAGLVRERFPQVKSIRLETVFHDTDGRPVQRRIREVTAEQFALFELRCPIEGALISLNEVVQEVIARHGRRRSGAIECTGDPEESGIVIPAHHMDYVVTVRYLPASTAKPAKKKSTKRSSAKQRASKASAKKASKSKTARSTKTSRSRQSSAKATRKAAKKTAAKRKKKAVVEVAAQKKSVASRRSGRRRAIA